MTDSTPRSSEGRQLRNLVAAVLAVAACTGVYYLLPLRRIGSAAGTWIFVALFAVGLIAVAAVILLEVAHFRSERSYRRTSMAGVIAALYLVVLFFAAVYYGLAVHLPGSLVSLHTKTDALYFSVSITGTVGFGDVYAAGQLARAVTTVHMAFNIGFVGAVVTVLRTSVAQPRD
ncbi:ion channel [Parasphingorhabdus pacifica]